MKKTMLVLIILMIPILLSGCNRKKDIDGDNGNVELTYYVWGNNTEVAAIQEVIDLFEAENPTIRVNIERAGDNYFLDLKMKFASGRGPDIFLMDPGEIRPFLEEDLILELDPYIAQSETLSLDDLWEVNDGYRFDGSRMGQGDLYALIKDWTPDFMLIYNKDHVAAYRQSVPDAFPYLESDEPMTWSQFLEFSQALTIGSGTTITRYGTTMDFVPYKHLFEWIQMTGDPMFVGDSRTFNRDAEGVIDAFEFFVSLQEGANAPAPYKGSSSLAVGGERFTLGSVSSVFLGRWAFVAYGWYDVDFEIGILPPPVPDNRVTDKDGKRIPYAGVSGMIANSVNKDSEHPDEAYKFIEFYQTVGMERLAELGYNIPGNKTIAYDVFLSVEDPDIRAINETFLDAAVSYSYPIEYNPYLSTTTIERIIGSAMSLYFERREGLTSLSALLDKIESDLNDEIRRQG
jgi:multiple sugar transport system substrate-binding protein